MAKYFTKIRFYYMFRVLASPMDAFYEIRHRERGSVPLAFICVLVLSALFTINRIFAGFIVNTVNPREVDGLSDIATFLIALMLISVGNWAITCLMNGEGRMKDIVTVVGYSTLPLVLALGPATIISRFITEEEAALYNIFIGAAIAWTAILLLVGIMTIHNYSLLKTLITLVLTLATMLIIIFIAMLLIDLLTQVFGFFHGIYTEISFRF